MLVVALLVSVDRLQEGRIVLFRVMRYFFASVAIENTE
jgi:hypothetical protein